MSDTRTNAVDAINKANATYLDANATHAAVRSAEMTAKQAVAEYAKERGVDPIVAALELRRVTG